MAQKFLTLNPNVDLNSLISSCGQYLSAQGYQVQSQFINGGTAVMIVSKRREGFSNIIGLGVECRVTLSLFNTNQLNVNIESEWTNKILAVAIGLICRVLLLYIPLIAGIIGTVNQFQLPEKIYTALNMSANGFANPYQPPYGQPPYNG